MRRLVTRLMAMMAAVIFTGAVGAVAHAQTTASYVQIVQKGTFGQGGIPAMTLTSAPNPSTYGQTVAITVTLPTVPNGGTAPTGTVTIYDGTTSLYTGTIQSGSSLITYNTATLSVGTHPLTATYSGDTNYNTYTTGVDNQVVTKGTFGQNGLGNITLSSAPNPSNYGQTVVFTATLPAGTNGAANPTGTVQFFDGTTSLGSGTISNGVVTLSIATLSVGTHPVTAVYSGDANYNTATSAVDNQVVQQATFSSSVYVLTSSPNPSNFGQNVTFSIPIPQGTNGAANPTGTITFFDGTTSLGTVTITSGMTTATYSTSTLSVGTHPVTAVYSGDTNYAGTTSNTDNQVVNTSGVTMTISGIPNPSAYTQTVTISVTVTPPTGGPTPTGTVSVSDGATVLGTITLSGGAGTLTVNSLAVGSHTITGTYSGDSNYH